MNISEAISKRRSIRKYRTGVQIPQKDIEKILEAAMMAPSACNCRPWEFLVVENEGIKKEIMEIMPYAQMLKTAPTAIIVCGRPDLQEGRCAGYWPQDCGAAIENMLLQALDLGYGTCWCGCYPVNERVERMQELLDVDSVPMAVVALGEPEEEPKQKGFFDPERVKYLR